MKYEKVSVNIGEENLAKMDLLMEGGFYGNRSDFINEAVSEKLERERERVDGLLKVYSTEENVGENQWFIGVMNIDSKYLETAVKQKKKVRINGFGVLSFSKDVPAPLIFEVIEWISPRIKIIASDAIKNTYASGK